ncbi:MAG: fibronectin type III domain-containing protein, partial [Turicibacter sp.]
MKRFLSKVLAVTVLMSSFSDFTIILAQTIASEEIEESVLKNDLIEVEITPELEEEIENGGRPEVDSTEGDAESNIPESETPGPEQEQTPKPDEGVEPDVSPELEKAPESGGEQKPEEGVEQTPEEGLESEVEPESTKEPEVDPEVQPDDETEEDLLPEDEEVPVLTRKSSTGTLEFDLHFPMPLVSTDGFNLVLTQSGGTDWVIDLASGNGSNVDASYEIEFYNSKREPRTSGDIYFVKVKITDLDLGEYTAKLMGSGYQDVTIPSIDLNHYSKRIKLASTRSELATPEEYPMAFLVGELTGDGVVTQADYDFLLEQLESNDLSYDLNRDGKLDITDLTYVYGTIGSEVKAVSVEDTNPILMADRIQIEAPDVTVGAGQLLSDLLVDESLSVLLSKGDNQAPSVDSPLKIEMDVATLNPSADSLLVEQLVIKVPTTSSDADSGAIESGFVIIEDESGQMMELPFNAATTRTVSDSLVIDLGSQVAVKKISINVTGNRGNKVISELAKVEFLNNAYKELPKPDMNIPTIKTVETSTNLHDERITISWDAQPTVTSYEVTYEQLDEKSGAVKKTKRLQTNETVLNILDKEITPYSLYRVKIQSLNGDWSSGYVTQDEVS